MDEFYDFCVFVCTVIALLACTGFFCYVSYLACTDQLPKSDKIQFECGCENCKCKDIKEDTPIIIPFPIITR